MLSLNIVLSRYSNELSRMTVYGTCVITAAYYPLNRFREFLLTPYIAAASVDALIWDLRMQSSTLAYNLADLVTLLPISFPLAAPVAYALALLNTASFFVMSVDILVCARSSGYVIVHKSSALMLDAAIVFWLFVSTSNAD